MVESIKARALALRERLTEEMLKHWDSPVLRERLRVQRNAADVVARRAAGDWTQYLEGAPMRRATLRQLQGLRCVPGTHERS